MQVHHDQQQPREHERREQNEESGVPELVRTESHDHGRAQAEAQRSHKPHGGENAEGRESDVTEVEKVGMHVLRFRQREAAGKTKKKTDPRGRASKRW